VNGSLMNRLALETGGSHFPEVFKTYQKDYTLNLLSEIYQIYQNGENTPDDYFALDLWDDIVKHFNLDNSEIDKLLKNNKQDT
jgi:hypothetical protein